MNLIKSGGFDVFHPTYYDPYFLPHLNGRPYVLTVYDMIHEVLPHYFPTSRETSMNKAMLVEKAAAVIAISENTKRDIVSILGTDPDKIEVIHLAPTTLGEPEAVSVPEQYVLFVGHRGRYKNFMTLARAFAGLKDDHPTLYLVCTGRDFTEKEVIALTDLGVKSRCVLIQATSGQLAYLYSHARAFVFPSEYEGFGLPVLEAFSCGCPTILSYASCFPEIAGDAAAYFDTLDHRSLEKELRGLLDDKTKRARLIDLGRRKAKEYSWKNNAEKTLAIYKRCSSAIAKSD